MKKTDILGSAEQSKIWFHTLIGGIGSPSAKLEAFCRKCVKEEEKTREKPRLAPVFALPGHSYPTIGANDRLARIHISKFAHAKSRLNLFIFFSIPL